MTMVPTLVASSSCTLIWAPLVAPSTARNTEGTEGGGGREECWGERRVGRLRGVAVCAEAAVEQRGVVC